MTDPRTDITEARRIAALWTGLLLAPCAFLLNLEIAYALVPIACRRGDSLPVHLVHAACLLLALGGALVARRSWRAEGARWPDEEGGRTARSEFMAGLGLLVSLLFVLVILSQWIPSFGLSPCQ
jgi:hypothetical protein